MASKLNGSTPVSPARRKRSPKKTKKGKQKDSPDSEFATAMGCSPSQAVIVQSTKTENAHLHPTILMVGEKSFQMLRELGELKFYHLAQYNEAEDTAEKLHHDFAAHLENPIQYLRQEQAQITSNYQVQERSTHRTCKIKTDYTIHVQSTEAELRRREDDLNEHENPVGLNNLTGFSNSLSHSRNIQVKAVNESSSTTLEKTLMPEEDPSSQRELNIDATMARTNCLARDPLDEIVLAPNTSCATSPLPKEFDTVEIKSKTKMLFGRNRIMPKLDASDKDDSTNLEPVNEY